MGKIIQLKLKILAKAILRKYNPEIIGITGSVGKTGAKEAVFCVLSEKYPDIRRSIKNYNNEIGVPLTIIGAEAQGKSFFGWIKVFLKGFKLLLFKDENYPKIVILEMGVDKPGDMAYLLSIARPKYGIITRIGESHLEFFKSVDDIKKEKELITKELSADGAAIFNADDEKIEKIIKNYKGKFVSYGLSKNAQVKAGDVNYGIDGISFKIEYEGKIAPGRIPNALGAPSVEAALAGISLGILHGIDLFKGSKALSGFKPPKGRLNIISGIKRTHVIDDTYNSSPQSCLVALQTIKDFSIAPGAKKFAVLGDMLELGSYTEEGHRQVGKKVFESGVNKLIVVGERSRDIARGAEEAGMNKDDIFYFPNSGDARLFVQDRIKEGDMILVKGSQGMRMEKIVKEIMADPLRAEELLVRQGKGWNY